MMAAALLWVLRHWRRLTWPARVALKEERGECMALYTWGHPLPTPAPPAGCAVCGMWTVRAMAWDRGVVVVVLTIPWIRLDAPPRA